MDCETQVALALGQAGASPMVDGEPWRGADRASYLLGWVVAAAIVEARYAGSALDALPVCHPDHGWDRFLLTRRVSCALLADEPADAFGLLLLAGDDAPRLAGPDGRTRLALGAALRADPRRALAETLACLPEVGLVAGDHERCRHTLAPAYPRIYRAVAESLLADPELLAAREVYVDDQQIEGAYHPLYLHSAGRAVGPVYDWFALGRLDQAVYVRIDGRQAIYRTVAGTWAADNDPLVDEGVEGIRERLDAWLHLLDRDAGRSGDAARR